MKFEHFDFGQATGGIVVRYRCCSSCAVRLMLDEMDNKPSAVLALPAAGEWRDLLLALPEPVSGRHDAFLAADEGVELESVRFVPSSQMVTGRNPLTGMDFPDMDVIRVGDVYYMISTTMYFMPGAVILRSYDLINWEYCTHVYDVLEDTPRQRLEAGNAYSAGMWAATLRYHKGTFYVAFVANDTRKTYLYRAESITGPWRKSIVEGFYHDCSLLFDDDDRVYLVYGAQTIHLLELNEELTGPKTGGLSRVIADFGQTRHLGYEGSHLYKINGKYYLFVIHSLRERWRRVESCLMSDSLTGEFKGGIVMNDDAGLRDDGVAQGAIVDTPDGRWYAMLFQDTGAVGRIPLLMPMAWEKDFPVLGMDGKVPLEVCNLTTRPGYVYAPLWGSDDFTDSHLQLFWEWNHIPQLDRVTIGGGQLKIRTGRVDRLLTQTQNLLTQRSVLPACAAEVTLDASGLQDGDFAGLCALQSRWGCIGLKKENGATSIALRMRRLDDPEEGVEIASLPWEKDSIRVRVEMHFSSKPEEDYAAYACLVNGEWRYLGVRQPLYYLLDHFTGYRFALFVQSTRQAGAEASFKHFHMEQLQANQGPLER